MMSDYKKGLLMALTTAVLWGGASSLAKLTSAEGLSQLSVVVYRAIVVVVLVGLWLLAKKGRDVFMLSRRTLALYVALGFLTMVCTTGGFMLSCVYLTIPQAVILHYTFPLLTILGDVFLTKERPGIPQILASVLIITGLYVGFFMGRGIGAISMPGLAWGTLSVFGVAGIAILTRTAMKDGRGDPLLQLFYSHLFGGLMLAVGKTALIGWGDLSGLTPQIFAIVQYFVLGPGLIAFALLFTSMRYISASTASLICSLEIVIAIVVMIPLFHTLPTAQEVAGSLIILFAVCISMIPRRSRRPS